jgi:hypothetical protein
VENRAMNACLSQHTDADALDRLKVAFVNSKRAATTSDSV